MFHGKTILVITPERLGDTLLCTPAIHYLKSNYPDLTIDVYAFSALSAQTLKNNPDIRNIILLNEIFRPEDYAFALNIHGENYLTEPFKNMPLKMYNLPEIDYTRPQAEFALEFVRDLAPEHFEITERHYRLFPDQHDRDYINELLQKSNIDPQKDILVGCQIGCHSIAHKKWAIFRKKLTHPKVWPFEYFLELAERLHKHNPHIRLVLTGSQNEKVLGNRLCKKVPSTINLIDKTNILQLRALIDAMDLFISPDTGVMHVACSANIPMIALFGPTNLARTGPYPTLNDLTVIQEKHMDDISVDQVYRVVLEKLSHRLQ